MSFALSIDKLKEISYLNSEHESLIKLRERAFEIYNKLPVEISPLYVKHHDLTRIDLSNAELNLEYPKSSNEIEEIISKLSVLPFIATVDGKIYKINIPEPLKEKGLEILDIRNLMKSEEGIKLILNHKVLNPEEDKFIALNDAFFSSGIFVSIPKGMILKLPLRILNFRTKGSSMDFLQNFIIAGEDSKFTIIEENYSLIEPKNQSLFSVNLNLILKEAAEVEYILINDFDSSTNFFANRRASCKKDSRITWIIMNLGGLTNRAKTFNAMDEQGVISNVNEIIVGDSKQVFDLTTYLNHNAMFTKGVAMTKGVLRDEARALLKGMIKIEEKAKNADAYLAEHAMILNRGARADSIPGLEIKNNEVRATHSASVAQVDEEQIFYLMARGLSEEEAKKLLTLAFFQPLIDQIPAEHIKEEMLNLIESKLSRMKRSVKDKVIISEELKEIKTISPEKLFETHYKYRK